MEKYAENPNAVVAEVDCTAEGKPLCEAQGVQGYPTLKWGDVSALEDYQGGRDLDALAKFAEENLKPRCSPANIDLCDEEIKKKEQEIKDAETTFETELEKLQKKYEEISAEKDETIKAVKSSGLGMMKTVRASKPKEAANDEL